MDTGKTILVVEDERIVARHLQLSLTDLGYRVPATAASAAGAMQIASEYHPDLVLMDIHLQGDVDGIQAAAMIHEQFDTPVIFITAHSDRVTLEKATVTRPYGFLVKPIDDTRLRTAVELGLLRHELELKARLSEMKFEGIVSLSADAIISLDDEGHIAVFNKGAEEIFGYSKDEAIGQPIELLIPERFQAAHHEHLGRFTQGSEVSRGMSTRRTVLGRRKNGEEFPAEAAISKLELAGRKFFSVSVRDGTERVRREEAQRFLAEFGTALVSSLDERETVDIIARLAVNYLADWCLIDVVGASGQSERTQIACRDKDSQELCDRLQRFAAERRLPPLSRPALEAKSRILTEFKDSNFDILAPGDEQLQVLKDMNPRWSLGVPLWGGGRFLGALVLVSSNRSNPFGPSEIYLVEEMAYRAGFAIENARLYEAAQSAIRARNNLLAIVSHDLKSPLMAVSLCAQQLASEGVAYERRRSREHVAVIQRSAQRMKHLIDGLRDSVMLDTGQFKIRPRNESVGALLDDAVTMLRPEAQARLLRLTTDLVPDLAPAFCDRQRILQVLSNLIGNAIKFTPKGGTITVTARPAGGDEVLITVADTGRGIPEDQRPLIFDRYWKGEGPNPDGTGLGLYIAKGIVEAHRGRIWVESQVGSGTTFGFTLPLAQA